MGEWIRSNYTNFWRSAIILNRDKRKNARNKSKARELVAFLHLKYYFYTAKDIC